MKRRDDSSMKPSGATGSAPASPASMPAKESSLSGLDPAVFQAFPRFPSVQDLLDHQAGTRPHPLVELSDTPPPPPTSLFQGLLGGRSEVLLQDALAHPENYDETTRALLMRLGTGGKPATVEELKLLDRATIEFATYRPPAPKPPAPKPPPPPKRPKLLSMDEEELRDGRQPEVNEPGSPLSSYWWVR